jgi:hypothetical protein
LNALYEAQIVAKKELREFQPIVQTTYVQMHHMDTIADSEWNSLVVSKPKECIIDANQQFVVEASLLARKWQDKVEKFQEVRKRSLELVSELGPLFEEAKNEIMQAESGRNLQAEEKGKQ